ncbi:hypothetical protein LASUN_01020 [Lentilactobacillus sunkii]|jgi:DUF917 family protein|uniref:DUF917 domain-containing protein n=1 Tax=Lentilactobacillus sunkii TaxID=481719 RepID=A0A1E7XJ41_9LACO|nr:DUF917 domain-containing protein [Lentilactobacillus sunkii]OFA13103.1 hypothetical protein LASUN_01020 [Lentilactobacillus sunkii]
MKYLTEQDIDYISVGASVLGSGGGGDPKVGRLLAKHFIQKYGPVKLISIDELEDDQYVVPVSGMGAPTVSLEKLPSEIELTNPLEELERAFGKKADVIIPIEVGGINSLYPVGAAAKLHLPILDADAIGRAFPEAQMETFHLHGLEPEKVAVGDEKGNVALLHPIDALWSEYMSRALTVQMGGSASVSDYFLPGRKVKGAVVNGTLSLARSVGEILMSPEKYGNVFDALLNKLNGFELYDGKVTDITRETKKGFNFGTVQFDGLNSYAGKKFSLEFQNENLVTKHDDKIMASVPDLIVALDIETGRPITSERLRYGSRAKVVSFPCDPQWRTPIGIETAGPRYFGYEVEYVPVEQLQKEGK